ncbi:LysR family transcriptional regulator [Enterococcus nangangensis]|uniref:LysR family transcriptional regulator n=1 Tax=Enterococcus nangangensis TaxID=2559926 RepID=UPI001FE29300|nr:LysR family transcriptional regulator [Enterococcus nangangensis]
MLKQLTTFKTVYETRSFSKTALLLFIAQPTVSAQIKQLENDLQTQLFIRSGRQELQVTAAADFLYHKTLGLLDDWEEVVQALRLQQEEVRLIRLGASHTFASYVLPQVLPLLHAAFPKIKFIVELLNSFEVLQALTQHQIDLGFIEKPLASKELTRHTLLADELVLVGDCKGPWLVRESSSGVYYYTQRYLEEAGLTPEILTIKNNEIIVALLRQGFGCSLLSKRAAEGLPYQKLGPSYQREFYLLQQKTADRQLEAYIAFIRQWSGKIDGQPKKLPNV